MIGTESFEIMDKDECKKDLVSTEYSCSLALKLIPTFMTCVESEKVYPLHTDIFFLTPIEFGAKTLYHKHFRL